MKVHMNVNIMKLCEIMKLCFCNSYLCFVKYAQNNNWNMVYIELETRDFVGMYEFLFSIVTNNIFTISFEGSLTIFCDEIVWKWII